MAKQEVIVEEYDIKTELIVSDGKKRLPVDYHCDCHYCKKFLGTLVRSDGSKYNKNDRRKYYSRAEIAAVNEEAGHLAKTPLHVARWAIQQYSKPKDWVLDPTMGSGSTAVEALNHNRNVAGVEIQFIDVIKSNIDENNPHNRDYKIWHGDARQIGKMLKELRKKFSLIINNPPYSGDESQKGLGDHRTYKYDEQYENLAFLREKDEYYDTMARIYEDACRWLKPGGHLVIGVKDMIRDKKPYMLHKFLNSVIELIPGMEFVGVALLPHYPTTLFQNTYNIRFPDVKVPMYQTISVFKKKGA
jgi:DNA modification methylase